MGGNARAVERAGWSLLKGTVTMYALAGLRGRAGRHGAGRAHQLGRSQHRDQLHAALDRGRHPRRRRVRGRPGVTHRRGDRCRHADRSRARCSRSCKLNPDWQIGAQGAILIIVLALRVLIDRKGVSR